MSHFKVFLRDKSLLRRVSLAQQVGGAVDTAAPFAAKHDLTQVGLSCLVVLLGSFSLDIIIFTTLRLFQVKPDLFWAQRICV